MKIDKNNGFQKCPFKISQNVHDIYDSFGYLHFIDGGCCFVGRFYCASC